MTVIGRIQGMGFDEKTLSFSDSSEIQDWSRQYIVQLVSRGVIEGYGDGRVGPSDALTRAQVAKILAMAT
jgi:hypothetical protein